MKTTKKFENSWLSAGWLQAGWSAKYEGVRDPNGYRFEDIKVSDPRFPNFYRIETEDAGRASRTFIVPSSDEREKISIHGRKPEPYIEYLNIKRKSGNAGLLQFVNKYGICFLKDDNCEDVESVQDDAKDFRKYVDRLVLGQSDLADLYIPFGDDLPCRIEFHRGRWLTVVVRTLREYLLLGIAQDLLRGARIAQCIVCRAYLKQERATRKGYDGPYCNSTCRSRKMRDGR